MDKSFLGAGPSPWYSYKDELQPDGFAHAKLVHSLEQNGLCTVCYDLPKMMNLCMNGHVICDLCLGRIRLEAILRQKHPKCPTCRATVSCGETSRNEVMEQILLETPETCANCKQTYKRKLIDKHLVGIGAYGENCCQK